MKMKNEVSFNLKNRLRNFEWDPNNYLDLHGLGVHYFDSSFLPSNLDAKISLALYYRGLTAPNALPVKVPRKEEINKWFEENYFKLKWAGVQHLGNECNLQKEEEFEKARVKILIYRMSNYESCEGAFGHWLVGNFCVDFMDDVFVDYAFLPYREDYKKYLDKVPLIFGSITKRPLEDFDIIVSSNSFSLERLNFFFAQVKSGIPLHYWERWDENLPYYEKCPVVCAAGIGATFFENMLGDNSIKGPGQNSVVDFTFMGEGELAQVKFLEQYKNVVVLDGGSKKDFRDSINNKNNKGWYDPTKTLFEYEDKVEGKKVWKNGGNIKRISILDEKNKTKYVMAGKESEEFMELRGVEG